MEYSIKPNAPVSAFLNALDDCRGEIIFRSAQGDTLDLKSQLCKYLFLTIPKDRTAQGTVSCTEADYDILRDYLCQTP